MININIIMPKCNSLKVCKNIGITMKMLIANSNSETIKNISLILNSYQPDWQVLVVDSGKECLDTIKNGNCPDAIILGMQLSDMSGLELTGRIRDDSDVPVIFLSDNNDIAILVKAFDAGANDYIVKPLKERIFIAKLEALLRRKMWDIQAN
jgi:PleD family two-component response regulator